LKRFSKGRLRWWPKADSRSDSTASREPLSRLAAEQLHVLLYNGDPEAAGMAEPWRRIALTPV